MTVFPEFVHRTPSQQVPEHVFASERGRCDLAEGLVLGATDQVGTSAALRQCERQPRGAPHCVIEVTLR
jgi:hypothetical protein